jgi:hypothetical protein
LEHLAPYSPCGIGLKTDHPYHNYKNSWDLLICVWYGGLKPTHGTWDSGDIHVTMQNCNKHKHFSTIRIKKSLKRDSSLDKMRDVQGQTWQAHIVTENVILAQKCNNISGNSVLWDLKQMLKDPIQQCGHLFVEAQQYTVFLDPSGVPSVSLHLDCRVGAPPSHLLLHPTIGHRHQGKLRLWNCVSRWTNWEWKHAQATMDPFYKTFLTNLTAEPL